MPMTNPDAQIFPNAEHIIVRAADSLRETNPAAAEILESCELLRENNEHMRPSGGGDVHVFDLVVVLPPNVQIIAESTRSTMEQAIREAVGVQTIPWYHVREVRVFGRDTE
jgi:hypothetical protein